MEIALISGELFTQNSPLQYDTVADDFLVHIILAQQIYIQPIIGIPLYEELQEQIKAASVTPPPAENPISPANQALLIKIAPVLSWHAVYLGLPFHWAKIINKGVTIAESENSKGVSMNDIAQIRRWMLDTANTLTLYFKKYLGGCDTYPLYKPAEDCGCNGDAAASNSPLNQGIYIPRPKRRCKF